MCDFYSTFAFTFMTKNWEFFFPSFVAKIICRPFSCQISLPLVFYFALLFTFFHVTPFSELSLPIEPQNTRECIYFKLFFFFYKISSSVYFLLPSFFFPLSSFFTLPVFNIQLQMFDCRNPFYSLLFAHLSRYLPSPSLSTWSWLAC